MLRVERKVKSSSAEVVQVESQVAEGRRGETEGGRRTWPKGGKAFGEIEIRARPLVGRSGPTSGSRRGGGVRVL